MGERRASTGSVRKAEKELGKYRTTKEIVHPGTQSSCQIEVKTDEACEETNEKIVFLNSGGKNNSSVDGTSWPFGGKIICKNKLHLDYKYKCKNSK